MISSILFFLANLSSSSFFSFSCNSGSGHDLLNSLLSRQSFFLLLLQLLLQFSLTSFSFCFNFSLHFFLFCTKPLLFFFLLSILSLLFLNCLPDSLLLSFSGFLLQSN